MTKEIYLAGGCFWGVEKYLAFIPGVLQTSVGYANGTTKNPSYEDVCSQDTGHTETVRVEYDPETITLKQLLMRFFKAIDPTTLNRQGPDTGTQYRSGVYYINDDDKSVIWDALAQLQEAYDQAVVVEVQALENYYPAEEYHQNYLAKNPGGYCHISPRLFTEAQLNGL